ncbi:hypothetical protein J3458_000671 [Metarhizium acridum]|uniref:uncharacterized protein n=1 Tax=Metarhizium acridum TaxID=92637 RepID=UPI001C6ADB53|nr:hypothetical protein J3458_000671 [Metarhizium acridum]
MSIWEVAQFEHLRKEAWSRVLVGPALVLALSGKGEAWSGSAVARNASRKTKPDGPESDDEQGGDLVRGELSSQNTVGSESSRWLQIEKYASQHDGFLTHS